MLDGKIGKKHVYVLSGTSAIDFNKELKDVIENIQRDGLCAEIQYSTTYKESTRSMVYSAIVIGRFV